MLTVSTSTRQWLNLVLCLAVPLVTTITFFLGLDFTDATSGERGSAYIVPAGYAFSIWGPIYLGIVAFAIYQMLPGQRNNPTLVSLGIWPAVACFFTVCWLLAATLDRIWMTMLFMLLILGSLTMVHRGLLAAPTAWSWGDRILVWLPMSLFIGWITLATFANLASALKVSGWIDAWLPEAHVTVVLLAIAAVVGVVATLWLRGNPAYALTLIWGLYAIVLANRARGESAIVVAAWITLGAVALAAVAGLLRRAEVW